MVSDKFPMRISIILFFLSSSLALPGQSSGAKPVAGTPDVHAKIHAMAFGAILASFNGDAAVTLSKDADPIRRQETLAKWWDVHSREELLALLDRIVDGKNGHRATFLLTQEKFKHLSPGMLWPTILGLAKAGDDIEDLVFVASYMHTPGGKCLALTAWDFGRYINLCRWGWDAGYLSEPEVWERVIPVARLLQKSYSSWPEYASDYMRGREYYSASATRENGARMQEIVNLLLVERPNGVWGNIPWEESLGEGPIAVDQFAEKIKARALGPDIKAEAPTLTK